MVPYDDKSPFVTSGIRLGVPALTTRGLQETHMEQVADWIDKILMQPDNDILIYEIQNQIKDFMSNFPLYPDWKTDL